MTWSVKSVKWGQYPLVTPKNFFDCLAQMRALWKLLTAMWTAGVAEVMPCNNQPIYVAVAERPNASDCKSVKP